MKKIIESYINSMSCSDIKNFLEKNHYQVNDNDINTILFYIKNYWEQVLDGDTNIFNEIKTKISESSYNIMIDLYNQYKSYL